MVGWVAKTFTYPGQKSDAFPHIAVAVDGINSVIKVLDLEFTTTSVLSAGVGFVDRQNLGDVHIHG